MAFRLNCCLSGEWLDRMSFLSRIIRGATKRDIAIVASGAGLFLGYALTGWIG